MLNLGYNFHLRFGLWLMKWFFKSGSFICYLEVDLVVFLVQGSKYSPQSKTNTRQRVIAAYIFTTGHYNLL